MSKEAKIKEHAAFGSGTAQTMRRKLGKSEAEIAEAVGISEEAYRRFEHGGKADLTTSMKIARALQSLEKASKNEDSQGGDPA